VAPNAAVSRRAGWPFGNVIGEDAGFFVWFVAAAPEAQPMATPRPEIDGHLKEARALLQMFCGGRLLAEENWMI
jgi:hypothetical protein